MISVFNDRFHRISYHFGYAILVVEDAFAGRSAVCPTSLALSWVKNSRSVYELRGNCN